MWYAPVFASIQTTTTPRLRAQAAAITLLISNMCAIGAGPTLVGVISDLLRPSYGEDSLRVALVIIVNVSLVGAIAAVFAGRAMRRQAMAGQLS
jgi:MFS transporter, Spinster family, sphingosine-1-phosphate transporter